MSTSHLQDNLDLLHHETAVLSTSLAGLGDADMRADTRCHGWSRGHVVTHVARNAEALGNLIHWAGTGERTEAYASQQARDADIEAGAGRGADALRADHEQAATELARRCETLHGPAADAEVVTRTGSTVRGAQVPSMRLLEVVIHHVDLKVGYSLDDADPGWLARTLTQAVRQLAAGARAPDVTLFSTEGDEWVIGEGTQYVQGDRADLLLWLARGDGTELQHEDPLPAVPAWG